MDLMWDVGAMMSTKPDVGGTDCQISPSKKDRKPNRRTLAFVLLQPSSFELMFYKIEFCSTNEARVPDNPTNATARSLKSRKSAGSPLDVDTTVDLVMKAAERSGLLAGKSGRITGRISPALLAQAKKRTGIAGDSQLVEFALATLALDDNFADAFDAARGTIDPTIELGF